MLPPDFTIAAICFFGLMAGVAVFDWIERRF